MEVLKRIALKHGMVCLLHEKPFAGINGSGKHNNWSVANDKGENLLEPGTTPHQNLRFLAVLAVTLKAVYDHADVLRTSIASPGNDHRLGANEAPPAIISVFMGSMLEQILSNIESGKANKGTDQQIIDLGVSQIPTISRDYTDRNRTSPFAFTGNKFEFRAVGSSANVAVPMSVLNAAVASSFKASAERLKELLKKKGNRDEAIIELVKEICKETKAIRFEGNGYSQEWRTEAKKRGLPILNTTPAALKVFNDKKATQFLVDTKVLSQEEIASRFHINVERYVKTLDIEFMTLAELVKGFVIPAVEKQLIQIGNVQTAIKSAGLKKSHKARLDELEKNFSDILKNLDSFEKVMNKSVGLHDEVARMDLIVSQVVPAAEKLRTACDLAETLVSDEYWTLPKYREMLFSNTLTS
jgi:glutamine synthetase